MPSSPDQVETCLCVSPYCNLNLTLFLDFFTWSPNLCPTRALLHLIIAYLSQHLLRTLSWSRRGGKTSTLWIFGYRYRVFLFSSLVKTTKSDYCAAFVDLCVSSFHHSGSCIHHRLMKIFFKRMNSQMFLQVDIFLSSSYPLSEKSNNAQGLFQIPSLKQYCTLPLEADMSVI